MIIPLQKTFEVLSLDYQASIAEYPAGIGAIVGGGLGLILLITGIVVMVFVCKPCNHRSGSQQNIYQKDTTPRGTAFQLCTKAMLFYQYYIIIGSIIL